MINEELNACMTRILIFELEEDGKLRMASVSFHIITLVSRMP
jgi:hypothetical protein